MIDTRSRAGRTAFAVALAAVAMGVSVLVGWLLGLEPLKRVVPGLVAMNPATAVAFILAGTSLAMRLRSRSDTVRRPRAMPLTSRLLALTVMLIGLAKLVSVWGEWDADIDGWWLAPTAPDGLRFPDRMSPTAALNSLLIGGALLVVDVHRPVVRLWVESSAVVVGFGSLLAVLSYAYDVPSFMHFGTFAPMALHTGVTFVLLAGAVLLSHTDGGWLALFTEDNTGGMLARRLIPPVIVIPAVLGWVTWKGEEAGLYSDAFSEAVFSTTSIVVFTCLVFWSARRLSTADVARLHAEAVRERAAEALRAKTALFDAQVNSAIDGILVVDERGRKVLQNQRMSDLFGMPRDIADDDNDEKQRRWVAGVVKNPELFAQKIAYLNAHPDDISRDELELVNGTVLDRYSAPARGADNKHYGRIWTFRDVTERKRLEAQLFQSQKMETIGKLAGGVAHEFNSLLTTVIGQAELLIASLPAETSEASSASEIRLAAERAATLTRQLLAYGRKQLLSLEPLDLNHVLESMGGMLRHLMGGDVDVRVVAAADLHMVQADAGQLEQVIMNIAINAHDAMPGGGTMTLETANVTVDESSVGRDAELKPGDYAMLAIADTGAGMTEDVKARIFEPFFTTKPAGEGSGLGLSTSYGIVKQCGGHLSVYTEVGRGTTFKIYLPRAHGMAAAAAPRLEFSDLPRGTETILLVQDDPALREMESTLLRRLGYTVLAAASGAEALRLRQQPDAGRIDMLFSDVVMPHMSGQELAERVRALNPLTRILFTSGYTANAAVHQGVLTDGASLLPKPFTPSALAYKLREVLDQPAAVEASAQTLREPPETEPESLLVPDDRELFGGSM